MQRPVANSAHTLHHFVQRFVLMQRNKVADGVIKIKSDPDHNRGNDPSEANKKPSGVSQLSSRHFRCPLL